MEINRITIIGQGNVATHLTNVFTLLGYEIHNVNSRTLDNLPSDSDLYVISVSDDAIKGVAARLPKISGIVVHTSGSVSMDVLSEYADRFGVFYPLQTFTKNVKLKYDEIPFFIEGSDGYVVEQLKTVAKSISPKVYDADSQRRKCIHIASVFACNYVNHLWTIADEILSKEGLSIEILLPLIDATVEKIHHISPKKSQTGPAVRGDISIINSHLNYLNNTSDVQKIYEILANRILKNKK